MDKVSLYREGEEGLTPMHCNGCVKPLLCIPDSTQLARVVPSQAIRGESLIDSFSQFSSCCDSEVDSFLVMSCIPALWKQLDATEMSAWW